MPVHRSTVTIDNDDYAFIEKYSLSPTKLLRKKIEEEKQKRGEWVARTRF